MNPGRFAIVAYKPFPGKEDALNGLVREHVQVLREQGLATDRVPYVMQCADGTIVEVFEWKSRESIVAAHDNAAIRKLWERYATTCEYVPLSKLAETKDMFAEFQALASPNERA